MSFLELLVGVKFQYVSSKKYDVKFAHTEGFYWVLEFVHKPSGMNYDYITGLATIPKFKTKAEMRKFCLQFAKRHDDTLNRIEKLKSLQKNNNP